MITIDSVHTLMATMTTAKKSILRILVLISLLAVSNNMVAQVGIGTNTPENTLHIKPNNSNEDPLKIEDLNQYLRGDSTLLVVDPTTGAVRFMHFDRNAIKN